MYIGRNLEYTSEVVEPLECKHKDGETSVKCELKILCPTSGRSHTLVVFIYMWEITSKGVPLEYRLL